MKFVVKRDGREVYFDPSKIEAAVTKAVAACGGTDTTEIKAVVEDTCKLFEDKDTVTVEEIQDAVEKTLIERGHAKTAKAYILYRAERTRSRDMKTNLMKIYEDLTYKDSIDSDIQRENANIDADTPMGTMLKYGSEGAKQFNSLYVLTSEQAKAHQSGDIHIHDFDFYTLTTTCTQIDLTKLFRGGFSTGHGCVREPNSIGAYASLACIAIQSNQNDQHGGQAIPKFDYDMAPGVKCTFIKQLSLVLDIMIGAQLTDSQKSQLKEYAKEHSLLDEIGEKVVKGIITSGNNDDINPMVARNVYNKALELTKRDTYQAMEALIHNLNTMNSRAGAQIPFSSINYGTDTSPEGRMVMKCLLDATDAGLGGGETPIFPIQIFKVKEGINYNPGDVNYDLFKLACKVSAKRLFPNFSFIDAPYNLQYYKEGQPDTEVAYMGCRTRVIGNVHDKTREIVTGRGNLSFTSINLPRLGIRAKGDVDAFYKMLDEKMELVIEQLYDRFRIQCSKHVYNYPFLMGQGIWIDSENLKSTDTVEEVLKHGTLSVGFIGLAECLKALIGEHHGESERAQKLGLEIITHMRKRLDEESEKTGLNYTLLATPAEGLSGRFVRIDKKKYGIIPGVTDRDYYTNSFHIPVYYPISAFNKIKLEAPYHALTNAGHISYIELDGDPLKNLDAFEAVVRCMKEQGIGYGAINHPVDYDPACGYTGVIDDVCPKCGRRETREHPFDRIRRITGYLVGTLDRFNNGKRAEEHDRVKHSTSR